MNETGWSFHGRDAERAALLSAVGAGRGVLVTGSHGVGKSALVFRALRDHDGVVRIAGGAQVAFGAFAHLLPALPPAGNALKWAAERLPAVKVLVIDDAHLLDAASAALAGYLAGHQGVLVVAVARSRAQLPRPIRTLADDGVIARLPVGALHDRHAARIIAGIAGGRVEGATVRMFCHAAAGDLRFLRELGLAARTAGALAEVGGVWCARGGLALSERLCDLVAAEIGPLDDDERDVVELVAAHETVDADALLGIAPAAAVHRLERRAILATNPVGRTLAVRLAHPLYQAVARTWIGPLRTRHQLVRLGPQDGSAGREHQVGHLASLGLTNREIADWLGLSHRTVGNHLHRLYAKLGVHDRAELAVALRA